MFFSSGLFLTNLENKRGYMFSFYDDGKGNGIYHLDGKLVTPNDDRLLSKVPAEITNESDFLSNVNTKMTKR
jgi:hypothetical protein